MSESILDWEKICKEVSKERDLWKAESLAARIVRSWIKDHGTELCLGDQLVFDAAVDSWDTARRATDEAGLK